MLTLYKYYKFAFKDLIFNLGLRVDRYDANQQVLKDPYVLFPTIKAGEYQINQGVTPNQLIELFKRGDSVSYSFTIIEGWTFAQALDTKTE